MSAIATFHSVPIARLDELRAKKRWFRQPADRFEEVLAERGRELSTYDGSGWLIPPLLSYLADERGIDLLHSEHDALASLLGEEQGGTFFVLTSAHERAHGADLDPSKFAASELRAYWEEMCGVETEDAGEPMLEGIRALRDALAAVDESSVVLLHVG